MLSPNPSCPHILLGLPSVTPISMEAELPLPHMITLNLSEQLDPSTYLKAELAEDPDWELTCVLPRLGEVPSVTAFGMEG